MAATSNFQGRSAKNDSLLQIEEIVRIYKYLDRNVRWLLSILLSIKKKMYLPVCIQDHSINFLPHNPDF